MTLEVTALVAGQVEEHCARELEGGSILDRRFDDHEKNLEVRSDGAAYGRVGLTARF